MILLPLMRWVLGTPEENELDYTIENLSDLIEICKQIQRGE